MGSNLASNIAYWTESPDHLMYPSGDAQRATNTWLNPMNQGPMHALTGGYSPYERMQSALAAGESTSTQQLGLALHRLGDSYAHSVVGEEWKMYSSPFGHATNSLFGIDPDKIANRPGLYKQYVNQLAQVLGNRLGFKGNVDKFTFNYVADSKGSTAQNSAILETEVRIMEGSGVYSVEGNQVDAIGNYIKASNENFGRNVQAEAVYTDVDVYNKNENGEWVKTKSEKRTFVNLH